MAELPRGDDVARAAGGRQDRGMGEVNDPGGREGRTAVQARVTGRVQGVAFRWHTQQQALALGVTGWVRNEVDGSVVLHAEGEAAAVEALVAWCRTGPPAARVSTVAVREAVVGGATRFEVTG